MNSAFSRPGWCAPILGLLTFAVAVNGCTTDDGGDDESAGRGGMPGSAGTSGADAGGAGNGGAGTGDDGGEGGRSGESGTSGSTEGGQGTGAAGDGSGGEGGLSWAGASSGGNSGAGGSTGENAGGAGGGGVEFPIDIEDDPNDGGSATTGPLVVKVTSSLNPAVPGQNVFYTVTIGNTAAVAVEEVNLLLRLPVGLQFVYTDAVPESSACGNGWCDPNEEATWNIGTFAAGSTRTIVLNPTVLNTVGNTSSLATRFRLRASGLNEVNFTKTIGVSEAPSAELSLVSETDPVVPGQTVEFGLDIGHIGSASLFEGELRAHLPFGLTALAASDGGDTSPDGREIVWPVDSLDVGATIHRSVTAQVDSEVPPGFVLNTQATFSYEGGADVDHAVQLPISVLSRPSPLALQVTTTPSPGAASGNVLYRATVANTSSRAVDGISLLFRVPRELQYTYTTHADPDSSTCANGWCDPNEAAVFAIGTLAAGASRTIAINPTILAANAGNGTLVTSWFGLRAANVNPIHLTSTMPVNGQAAAQLQLGAEVDVVVPGQTFTYELDVGQVGAAGLQGTELVLNLPSGVEVDRVSDGGTEPNPGEVRWNLGTIPVTDSRRRTVTVTVDDALAPATLLMARATLTYNGGAELDARAEFVSTVVAEELPLSVTLDTEPNPVTPGGRLLYTATIENTSNTAMDDVDLLLRLPAGLTFVYTTDADPDSSSCGNGYCEGLEEAEWALGTIEAGETRTVEVNAATTATLVPGSLLTMTGRILGANLGATINLQETARTAD